MHKPRLIDLYCGAGGCSKGYQEAGFHVTGVDNKPQPHYCGDDFVQADALEFLKRHGHQFDAYSASPPCQRYLRGGLFDKNNHPALIEPTRDLFLSFGKPFVIENVPDAPLRNPIILAGTLFGLKVLRQRAFECSFPVPQPPLPEFTGKVAKMGRPPKEGEYIAPVGHFSGVPYARTAMGIPWMRQLELAQAIPPAYTKYIGDHLMRHLQGGKRTLLDSLFAQVSLWRNCH